jgi:CO dehydrogenase nickel-insertion accessory protein CooC1
MAGILAESLFDKFDLVIIDAGSEIDNGLAFGALGLKCQKYIVMEQTESSLKRYEKNRELYERFGIYFNKYILNKYFDNDPLTINYVSSRLGLEKSLFMNVKYQENGRIAEMEYRSLLETGQEKYKNDVLEKANDIMREMNLEKICLKRKRSWNNFI